jgi:hypothetical protein
MGLKVVRPISTNHACLKITNGSKEISIAFDDSCGAFQDLSRGDIALFQNDKEVTQTVFNPDEWGRTVHAALESLKKAIAWVEE